MKQRLFAALLAFHRDERGFWNLILPAIGAIAGGIGGARGKAKEAQANTTMNRDQQALEAERARLQNEQQNANLELQRRQYEDSAPASRLRDIAHAQSLRDVQDVRMNRPDGVPEMSFSGGLRPSLFDGMTRGAADFAARDGVRRLAQGDQWQAPQHMNFQQGALPKSGFLDKLLAGASLVGSGYEAISPMLNRGSGGAGISSPGVFDVNFGNIDPSLAREYSLEDRLRSAGSTPPFVSPKVKAPKFG